MNRRVERPDLEAFYEAELSYVWNTLRRLGVPDGELEDVAHDVFQVALERLHSFDEARPLRPWIFGIALRIAARFRRRPGHGREIAAASPDAVDEGRRPDEAASAMQERAWVASAIQSLELDRRAVVILHDLDGQTMPEIAAALGLRLNTAYSRLRLGRADLVAALRRPQGVKR